MLQKPVFTPRRLDSVCPVRRKDTTTQTRQEDVIAAQRHLFAVPNDPKHLSQRVEHLTRRIGDLDAVVAEQAVGMRGLRSTGAPVWPPTVHHWQQSVCRRLDALEALQRQLEGVMGQAERTRSQDRRRHTFIMAAMALLMAGLTWVGR